VAVKIVQQFTDLTGPVGGVLLRDQIAALLEDGLEVMAGDQFQDR
jgi:hypothetical protein